MVITNLSVKLQREGERDVVLSCQNLPTDKVLLLTNKLTQYITTIKIIFCTTKLVGDRTIIQRGCVIRQETHLFAVHKYIYTP